VPRRATQPAPYPEGPMPNLLLPLVGLLLLWQPATLASAQEARTALLAGYGGIDHEASLGPAYHLNLRYRLARWDSVPLPSPPSGRERLPGLEIQAEAFAQRGESGWRVGSCAGEPEWLCSRSARPLYLVGAGLVGHVDLTSAARPVQLYFLPLTAALYLRGYDLQEHRLGSVDRTAEREVRLSGGAGNGLGLKAQIGGVRAMLEMRAILVRDLRKGRGGSLPVSLGLTW
jgi:hypothetical protein